MAKEREFCCTIAAPSIINFENHCICQCNVNGQFPIRHWLTLQASDHISRKCEIWKYVDYHMNIQSILTSNGFLDISIHIWSCGSDFWKYLLLFSHSNSPKLTGLPTFGQFDHIPRFHSSSWRYCLWYFQFPKYKFFLGNLNLSFLFVSWRYWYW